MASCLCSASRHIALCFEPEIYAKYSHTREFFISEHAFSTCLCKLTKKQNGDKLYSQRYLYLVHRYIHFHKKNFSPNICAQLFTTLLKNSARSMETNG